MKNILIFVQFASVTNCMLLPLCVLCSHQDKQFCDPIFGYGLYCFLFTLLWQQIESHFKSFKSLGRNNICCKKAPLSTAFF